MTEKLDFGVLLAVAYSAFVDEMRGDLAARGYAGLHRSFGYVARALDQGSLTLRELAERLGVTSPGALKIVDEMVAAGHLERADDPTDGRAKRISLTDRGQAALAAARRFHARFEERLAALVGERRALACREALEAIIEARTLAGAPPALRPV